MALSALDEGTVLLYDSGVVGGGVQIQTPVLDTRQYGQLCVVVNNAHVSSRTVNIGWGLTGPTIFSSFALSIASAGDFWQFLAVGGGYSSSANFSNAPAPFTQFTMAAGGATTARMVVWGR